MNMRPLIKSFFRGKSTAVRDHDGAQLTRVYAPGNSHRGLGVVTGASGNWTLQVSLSGNADVRLVVAGAIEYGWTL